MVLVADSTDPRNPKSQNPRRTLLLDNGVGSKKHRSRQVHSRYMPPSPSTSTSSSSSSSKRYPSPMLSRPPNLAPLWSPRPNSAPKRAQSADRRRQIGSRPTEPLPESCPGNAISSSKNLFTSTRSLPVSFQGETFSLPISKAKTALLPVLTRKLTPERRRSLTPFRVRVFDDQAEVLKMNDPRPWPGKTHNLNPPSASLNCANKLIGLVKKPMMSESRTCLDLSRVKILKMDHAASDRDSISSGCMQEQKQSTPRSIAGSARFWQETNSRLRRLQNPGEKSPTTPVLRMVGPRGSMSPVNRNANSSIISNGNLSPASLGSVLNFCVDVQRGKARDDHRIVDSHMMKILYNRALQWRFVNANAKATTFMQRKHSEKSLWNASVTISDLRRSVRVKRVELQLMRQKLKLTSILMGQMGCLEECVVLDREHFVCLIGAVEALRAATFRLPLIGGAKANVQNVKDVIGSALNVMHTIASSICSFLSKVEKLNSLIKELEDVTAKERALLRWCEDIIRILASMQEKDCSLRAHKIQLYRLPTTAG